jgi:hypothetical protein
MRLSRVCGLAARQRVSLTLERFDDLAKNEKNELFKNCIQAYVEYLEELKEKGKKVAMKIMLIHTSHFTMVGLQKLVH